MLATQPRGTSDMSRIATDHINNPNAINAIFLLAERERIQIPEKMAGGTLALPEEEEEMPVAHVPKDGADFIVFSGAVVSTVRSCCPKKRSSHRRLTSRRAD